MSSPLVLSDVAKRYGAQTLFEGLSLSVRTNERLGIVGPNGAGKSTLLKLMAGLEEPDSGSVIQSRGLRVHYVAQTASFSDEETPLSLARAAALDGAVSESEREAVARTSLGSLGIDFEESPIGTLSGGQQKRVQIAVALCANPDLLLLDEPTNHLDIEAILAIESLLSRSPFGWIVISHDRWFLENAVSKIVEVNRKFEGGLLQCDGGYADYVERRMQVLAAAEKQLDTLKNKVRGEQAWLRQGAKARSTKSKERTSKAYAMMDSLSMVRSRSRDQSVEFGFQFSERKTKRLIELFSVGKQFENTVVLNKLSLKIMAGDAIGLLGRNGSGKTTLIRMLADELQPDHGTIKKASDLSVSYFRQVDSSIAPNTSLKEVLATDGDSVVYQGRSVHVATWAKRFQFSFEQLNQPFSSLSGGERARARIARLMLETPDVLILDEPTNDLDIETIELLEESLLSFRGALVLVSHDRFMINRLCTNFLGLDGKGSGTTFADYEQWEKSLRAGSKVESKNSPAAAISKSESHARVKPNKKRLGYLEQREFDGMEGAIEEAEEGVERLKTELSAPEVQADSERLAQLCIELDQAQQQVKSLYERWEELEEKQK